jgi:putative transposase
MVYQQIESQVAQDRGPSVSSLCRAAGVSRAGFYRRQWRVSPPQRGGELRQALRAVAIRMPAYGYRRITAALQHQGLVVNRKRVLRMMREENLLCQPPRPFHRTTDSAHDLAVYPNLARGLKVTASNQLWVADLTYINLTHRVIYLALILDAFARRVVGWALGPSLKLELPLAALRMALAKRRPKPGLIHHSDRGVQYASREYVALLKSRGIRPSMSRRGNPYDNAFMESMIKTLKYEEVYRNEYDTLTQAHRELGRYLINIYNSCRLHSAIGYHTPVEYERLHRTTQPRPHHP